MIGEVLQRLVVERGQAVAEERCLPIAEDGDHEIARRHGALEYRVAPYSRRQRHGNDLVGTGGRSDAAEVLGQDLRGARPSDPEGRARGERAR